MQLRGTSIYRSSTIYPANAYQPYAHITGRGFYDGSISNMNGASIDAEFDVFFDPKANAYIPVSGVTKRVSLVAKPACKVCKFIPK